MRKTRKMRWALFGSGRKREEEGQENKSKASEEMKVILKLLGRSRREGVRARRRAKGRKKEREGVTLVACGF